MSMSRNVNPYAGVCWDHRIEVTSCTHMHCTSQDDFRTFLDQGLELAAFSNYYPSAPYYPLREVREHGFRCGQGSYVRDGQWHADSIDWNREIGRWADELDAEHRKLLPFRAGEVLFRDIPSDLLEVPNAEHHYFTDLGIWLHVTTPGALLCSSHFDRDDSFGLVRHGYGLGAPVPWRSGFRRLIDSMMVSDGGGIVIAHPEWSHLPLVQLTELLDFDPAVLGIEIFNYNDTIDFGGYADYLWDAILSTGRQCFGFAVQDHLLDDREWKGRIILLPAERTAESCLRAMRQGRFYCALTGNPKVRFDYLALDGRTLRARCNEEVMFQLIARTGVVGDLVYGRQFEWTLPEGSEDAFVFLRLTATEMRRREKLFAQPFMLL